MGDDRVFTLHALSNSGTIELSPMYYCPKNHITERFLALVVVWVLLWTTTFAPTFAAWQFAGAQFIEAWTMPPVGSSLHAFTPDAPKHSVLCHCRHCAGVTSCCCLPKPGKLKAGQPNNAVLRAICDTAEGNAPGPAPAKAAVLPTCALPPVALSLPIPQAGCFTALYFFPAPAADILVPPPRTC